MRQLLTFHFAATFCAALAGPLVVDARAAETWTIEDSSEITFTAFQQGRPVEGTFEEFMAEVVFEPENLEASRVEVVIDTSSIDTGHGDRDATLRSSQFFDVERWPQARFASDDLAHAGGDQYEAQGTLTIRDVTRDVALPFTLTIDEGQDEVRARAEGEITISRLDFGVGQGDWANTRQVGEEVVIRIMIEAHRPA